MKILIFIIIVISLNMGNAFAQTDQQAAAPQVTISLDKKEYKGGEVIKISGTAPPGRPVYIEIASEKKVQVSRLDSRRDPDTGKIPYIFYLSKDIPPLYMILMPKELQEAYKIEAAKGKDWSVARMLATTGAEVAYITPAKAKVERWQASIMATILGSRGDKLEPMDEKGNKRQSMPLMKTRYRWPDRMFSPVINVNEDGTFTAEYTLPDTAPSGAYTVIAVVDKELKSDLAVFKHELGFAKLYFDRAGQSLNVIGPFMLAVLVCTFGVVMGAGGGFILNPLLIFIYGIPHAIVAGSVLPSVLFSQGSGIYNYSKIKFINWKLGVSIGIAMLAGGFIGPKLTEMITLEQYKFLFGWVLLILAAIMLWQTMPGYIAKSKKDQAILKEFKKRAEEAAAKKASKAQQGGKS